MIEPREQFARTLKYGPVPDLGDVIQKKVDHEREAGWDRKWRVSGWLKAVELEKLKTGDFLKDVLLEQAAEELGNGYVLVWCERHEATHVTGSGVAGCLLPIGEVEVVGRVNWSEGQLQEQIDSQRHRIGEYLI